VAAAPPAGFTARQFPFYLTGPQASTASPSNTPPGLPPGFVGDRACSQCHQNQFDSYLATAHHRTSRLPNSASIAGQFTPGKNLMTTLNPQLSFRMEARDGHFYQTAILNKPPHPIRRTEQIDIVIGSATKGQTYLYWRNDALFELPVSYWTELKGWVNSPGYVDGSADFDRPVTPRCLECHATYFQPLSSRASDSRYDKNNFVLSISCERCHGPGLSHVQTHLASSGNTLTPEPMPPIKLARDREIDICAQCHGGVGKEVAPPFSFTPGQPLSQYIVLQAPESTDRVDVHGNQVILLERSRCFQSSPEMSCSTCHDVHSPERTTASYSTRCLHCHQPQQCGKFATLGPQIAANCVDCHMPVQASKLLVLDADDTRFKAKVRNHWIRVYRNSAQP
jgi:Cytochrome c554 and c-prime